MTAYHSKPQPPSLTNQSSAIPKRIGVVMDTSTMIRKLVWYGISDKCCLTRNVPQIRRLNGRHNMFQGVRKFGIQNVSFNLIVRSRLRSSDKVSSHNGCGFPVKEADIWGYAFQTWENVEVIYYLHYIVCITSYVLSRHFLQGHR
jgi:hypothetical protein